MIPSRESLFPVRARHVLDVWSAAGLGTFRILRAHLGALQNVPNYLEARSRSPFLLFVRGNVKS